MKERRNGRRPRATLKQVDELQAKLAKVKAALERQTEWARAVEVALNTEREFIRGALYESRRLFESIQHWENSANRYR